MRASGGWPASCLPRSSAPACSSPAARTPHEWRSAGWRRRRSIATRSSTAASRSAPARSSRSLAGRFACRRPRLRHYLLYTTDGRFLAAGRRRRDRERPGRDHDLDASAAIPAPASPSTGGSLRLPVTLERRDRLRRLPRGAARRHRRAVARQLAPEAAVTGTIDAHTHVTAFEFLGGELPLRPSVERRSGSRTRFPTARTVQQGFNGQVESFLDYGAPLHAHDTRGWPTFRDWPSPTDLAEEGDYYTGIKRAWMAGLRVMVTHLVDNEALCDLMTQNDEPVRRHGGGPHPGGRPARAAGLHRRAVRRPRQGLLPDRHQPVPGPSGDQRGQARGRRGDRGLRPVPLRQTPARCQGRRRPEGGQGARREHVLPGAQVRQRLRRRTDGQRASSGS